MSFGRGRFCTGLDEDYRNWKSGVVKRLSYILIDVKLVHPVFTFVEEYVFNFMPV